VLDTGSIVDDPEPAWSFSFVEETNRANSGIFSGQKSFGLTGKEVEMRNSKPENSFHAWEIEQLKADRELTVEFLIAAMESLDNPDERAGGLLALRDVAEAYGGLGAVAAQAGISRESLYRALSPKGNPTLKTLIAVLNAVGLRLSVTPAQQVRKRQAKTRADSVAA
jgi:probable addiction module antidote protein